MKSQSRITRPTAWAGALLLAMSLPTTVIAGSAMPKGAMQQATGSTTLPAGLRKRLAVPEILDFAGSMRSFYDDVLTTLALVGSGEPIVETNPMPGVLDSNTVISILPTGEVQFNQTRTEVGKKDEKRTVDYAITFSADGQGVTAIRTGEKTYSGYLPLF